VVSRHLAGGYLLFVVELQKHDAELLRFIHALVRFFGVK
jgi:hypothetical protein